MTIFEPDHDHDTKSKLKIASLVEAEEAFLAKARISANSVYFSPNVGSAGSAKGIEHLQRPQGRRHFLASVAALAGSGVAGMALAQTTPPSPENKAPAGAVWRPVPEDATKTQGVAIGEDGGYGTRSQFETEVRWRFTTKTPFSSWSMTPLEHGVGIITPSGLHFERDHGGIATIDPATHKLFVHGMVKQPKKFSMSDVKRFPSISRIHFIECSGNGLTEWSKPTLKTVQGTHGLVSTSEWTGVPLSIILNEVGVRTGAKWLLVEGGDASVMTRSIPLEKAMKDCFLAYGQNGEAIRPEQGYPLRLIVPGYEGNTHIKWVRRIELADMPFMTREETSKYTDLLPNGKAVQFSMIMEAKSVITRPSGEMVLPGRGFYEITGMAWSGRGRIKRVDVSTDGGRTWKPAQLQDPILPVCQTRFRYPWVWNGKEAILQSRCVDETGYVQPTLGQLIDIRGLNGPIGSVYHLNAIQSWKVDTEGRVSNVHYY
ncbi:sulfite dehydrogenase [Sulfuriferula plumbiphila]|uniref:Sulfite dehydrogenase n=1 Tax=Sulfuriferula plumbiphila TaxID=171865 RepID=A0A512LCK1_9PROT|nr:sulfite dehydrogenase [Sulfuriferula plumbiphila]GEP32218.1 sulfite dehydrogenase [Sulfuriferula plumbiphila]